MIIYFSGTGNTAFAAKTLANLLGDDDLIMSDADMLLHPEKYTFSPKSDWIVWAFPIYSYGVAPVMLNFIRKVNLDDNAGRAHHYMLTTCGGDMGYADRMWRKELSRRGLNAKLAFGVQMPKTYVCMKNSDVDSPEVVKRKLSAAPKAIERIASAIRNGGSDIIIRKSFSWIKTYVIYPLFEKYGVSSKSFHHSDGCISCGKCAHSCPMHNISMVESHPKWSDHCAMCLRCYHTCPVHAVAYGKHTALKGQYTIELKQL